MQKSCPELHTVVIPFHRVTWQSDEIGGKIVGAEDYVKEVRKKYERPYAS